MVFIKMNKRKIIAVVQSVVSILLLVLLFNVIDFGPFLDLLRSVRMDLFIAGILLYFLSLCISAFRWRLILRSAGGEVGIVQLIEINFIGSFFSIFLPTAAGGDLARMYESTRQGMAGVEAVSTVLLDRIIGLISLVVIASLALVVGYRFAGQASIIYAIAGMALVFFVGWRLFFNRELMRRFGWIFDMPLVSRMEANIKKLYTSLYRLHDHPRLFVSTVNISLVMQVIEILSAVFVARALGITAEIFHFFVFIPLIWLVTMLPVSLNGLGLREGAFAFFFSQVGVVPADAVALSLLVYSCRLLSGLLGGGMFLRTSLKDSILKWRRQNDWAD
jgi:hypothetical protein